MKDLLTYVVYPSLIMVVVVIAVALLVWRINEPIGSARELRSSPKPTIALSRNNSRKRRSS